MKTALLLLDIQNDYFPSGKMELSGSPEAAANAGRLLSLFRENGLPLVHIQHMSVRAGATFFLPDTPGVEFHESVRPLEGEMVVRKHYPNAFRETTLLKHLRGEGVERLVVAGMMTHMCVDATVRAACDLGFACLMVEDACATRALVHRGKSVSAESVQLSFLAALGTADAKVMRTEEIPHVLLRA